MFGGSVDEEGVDVVLGEETEASAFADVDALGGGRDEREDFWGDEGVVENDFGGLEEACGFAREEVGVAGARAEEEDLGRVESFRGTPRATLRRPFEAQGKGGVGRVGIGIRRRETPRSADSTRNEGFVFAWELVSTKRSNISREARWWSWCLVASEPVDFARSASRAAPSESSQAAYSGPNCCSSSLRRRWARRGTCHWWRWRSGDRRAGRWSRSRNGNDGCRRPRCRECGASRLHGRRIR